MVAGADGDTLAIQQGGDVVGVGALHGERDDAAAILRLTQDAQTFDGCQPRQCVLGDRLLISHQMSPSSSWTSLS